jgi:hypothetical protein
MGRDVKLAQQFLVDPGAYLWGGNTRNEPQLLTVIKPGLHEFSVWIRESGQIIDKILLTKDLQLTPADAGPPESEKAAVGGRSTFTRGDARNDSKINVADALAVLFHLFSGVPVNCEDYADVDDNGKVELTDAIALLVYLFQRGPPPAPPFPAAGYDTTPDSHACGDG